MSHGVALLTGPSVAFRVECAEHFGNAVLVVAVVDALVFDRLQSRYLLLGEGP